MLGFVKSAPKVYARVRRTSEKVAVRSRRGGSEAKDATVRKLAHAINRDFLAIKTENFQLKNFDIFLIFAQNIDCGYTLEPPRYPQSIFWSKNKKNRYTPAYPSFAV